MIQRYKKYSYSFSAALIVVSIFAIFYWGLPLGIDFAGGSLLEVRGVQDRDFLEQTIDNVSDSYKIQELDSDIGSFSIRLAEIDDSTRKDIMGTLQENNPGIQQDSFSSVGPTIGAEIRNQSFWAIGLVLVAILIYISFAFRRLSYPLASWQYGVVTLITLLHDIIISVGIATMFIHFTGKDVGVPFVAALLTVLGYSVNDTIVVFDRIRENIRYSGANRQFSDVVDKSTRDTVVRSLNSSLTTLLVLVAIFIFGGQSLALFMFTLIIGVSIGTYSSLAIASPLVVDWVRLRSRFQR